MLYTLGMSALESLINCLMQPPEFWHWKGGLRQFHPSNHPTIQQALWLTPCLILTVICNISVVACCFHAYTITSMVIIKTAPEQIWVVKSEWGSLMIALCRNNGYKNKQKNFACPIGLTEKNTPALRSLLNITNKDSSVILFMLLSFCPPNCSFNVVLIHLVMMWFW